MSVMTTLDPFRPTTKVETAGDSLHMPGSCFVPITNQKNRL